MSIVVSIEGGGDNKTQQIELRRAFSRLFENLGLRGRMPTADCSGGRKKAYDNFLVQRRLLGERALLLVDAEGGVPEGQAVWKYLGARQGDQWSLEADTADQVFLMVQLMESWFLADADVLASWFGPGFNSNHLPGNSRDIEPIRKADVVRGIDAATRGSKRGKYEKGRDSHEVLGRLDPDKIEAASPHAKRFFDRLRQLATSPSPQTPR